MYNNNVKNYLYIINHIQTKGGEVPSLQSKTQNISLLTPLGLSPGLLFTALEQTRPARLFLVTSQKGKENLPEIIKTTKFKGEIKSFIVNDPFTCFNDAAKILQEIITCPKGEEWVINLTGGTTALQFIIQKIAEELVAKGNKVKYTAMIDRRKPEEQRANPYVVGEMLEIDV